MTRESLELVQLDKKFNMDVEYALVNAMEPSCTKHVKEQQTVGAPIQRKNIVQTAGSSILFPSNDELSHDLEFECRPKLFTGLLRLYGPIPCTWMKVTVDLSLVGSNAPTLRLRHGITRRIEVIPVGSCRVQEGDELTFSVITNRRTLTFGCPNEYERHYWVSVLQEYASATII